ncbi:MAG TPA: hypothetical protein DEF06_04305, partial [Clostridiales bacterium]|nr:hypothetical protein [Clostridiales bacterium]
QTLPGFVFREAEPVRESSEKERFYVRVTSQFNDTDFEELKFRITEVFGENAVYLGYALSDNTTAGFLSDRCSEAELRKKLDMLSENAGIRIAYTMRVAD